MLQPRRDLLLVEPQKLMQSHGGILFHASRTDRITSSQDQYGHRGRVVARGPLATQVDVGQMVRFGEFMVQEYADESGSFWLISEKDVTCVEES